MYYAVFRSSDRVLHSIERNIDAGLPEGMDYVEVEEYAGLEWNPTTLSFDVPVAVSARTISRKQFIERFTAEEWVTLVALKSTDPVIAAVFERLVMLDEVELDAPFTQAMATHVVAQGYLTQERIDEVLA